MKKKRIIVGIGGDAVPLVQRAHFSAIPKEIVRDAWQIIGPSADVNLRKGLPLWKVIAAAYIEGLQHGASIMAELEPDPVVETPTGASSPHTN